MVTNKNLTLTFGICLLSYLVTLGQETRQIIRITHLENVTGYLYIGWYNQAATFRINDQAIYRQKIKVDKQDEIEAIFTQIPQGRYAIAVFLDENDNYQLDRNLFGIPKEKYGFSNNVLPALRPATFEESVFNVNQQEGSLTIKLK